MVWSVILLTEVEEWYLDLAKRDPESANLIPAAIDMLEDVGPNLSRPLADRLKGSKIHNLKELRPGSAGDTEVRIIFVFDPQRQAVLLVAGDKSGAWDTWYPENIKVAEQRYQEWLDGER
jgi:hypothetical protein